MTMKKTMTAETKVKAFTAVGLLASAVVLSNVAVAPTAAAAAADRNWVQAKVDCKVRSVSGEYGTTEYKACGKLIDGKKHVRVTLRAKDTRRDAYCATAAAYLGHKDSGIRLTGAKACGKNAVSNWKSSKWQRHTKTVYVYALAG